MSPEEYMQRNIANDPRYTDPHYTAVQTTPCMTEMQGSQAVRRVPRFPESASNRGLHNCDNIGLAAAGALPEASTSAMEQRYSGVNRAVHNSPPPLDDVGADVTYMLDEKDPDLIDMLLDERHITHGSFANNSHYGQILRNLFRGSPGWVRADDRTREVLDYVAGKLSRILSGMPNEKQHWEDIAGFARLQFHPDKQR